MDEFRTIEFDPGYEAMIFSADGVPLQGKVLAADNDAASSLGITSGFDGIAAWSISCHMKLSCGECTKSSSSLVATPYLASQ